jgi:hypothetical protein
MRTFLFISVCFFLSPELLAQEVLKITSSTGILIGELIENSSAATKDISKSNDGKNTRHKEIPDPAPPPQNFALDRSNIIELKTREVPVTRMRSGTSTSKNSKNSSEAAVSLKEVHNDIDRNGFGGPGNQLPTLAFINSAGTFVLQGHSGFACYQFEGQAYVSKLVAVKRMIYTRNDQPESGWLYKIKGEEFYFLFSKNAFYDMFLKENVHRFYYSFDGETFLPWKVTSGTRCFKLADGESLSAVSGNPNSERPDPTLPGPNSDSRDKIGETLERFLSKHLCIGNKGKAKIKSLDYANGVLSFTLVLNHKHEWNGVTVFDAESAVSGQFDPYNIDSIENTQVCVELNDLVKDFAGKGELCITLAEIAKYIAML